MTTPRRCPICGWRLVVIGLDFPNAPSDAAYACTNREVDHDHFRPHPDEASFFTIDDLRILNEVTT